MRTHLSVYPTGALLCNEGGSLREKKEKTKMRGRRGGEEGERGVNFHTQAVLPSAVLNIWEIRQCGLVTRVGSRYPSSGMRTENSSRVRFCTEH